MALKQLVARVDQAEASMQAQHRRVSADTRQFTGAWRMLWSPGRIVLAGLASGLLIGRSDGGGAANASSVLKIVSALSGMLATAKARDAADEAAGAADSAEDAADAVQPDTAHAAASAAPQ